MGSDRNKLEPVCTLMETFYVLGCCMMVHDFEIQGRNFTPQNILLINNSHCGRFRPSFYFLPNP